jgi:hypothetical protein
MVSWQRESPCVTLVTVRRFGYLVVVLCTLAVLSLGLVALFSGPVGRTTQRSAVCAEPPLGSAKVAVVPNAQNKALGQADWVLCRAGLNDTYQGLPGGPEWGAPGVWTVASQSPAPGSHVPVGSNVVLTIRDQR